MDRKGITDCNGIVWIVCVGLMKQVLDVLGRVASVLLHGEGRDEWLVLGAVLGLMVVCCTAPEWFWMTTYSWVI